ncbi:MAG: hypothetical protein HY027_06450 [Deltaproteobacteria bacterium]|nr:hypothetical protein [Deltaproteobacteria bacterium]
MRPTPSRQHDLFEEDKPTAQVPSTLTATLVRRIGELLVEAIGDGSVKARTGDHAASEAGHEQDHA